MDVRGLLLCGGASVRFGRDKLLEKIGDRYEPMAALSARAFVSAMGRVLAVTRAGRADLRRILEGEGCEVMETDRAVEGLGGSLAAGVEASANAGGWVVALADMPFIRAQTSRTIRTAIEEGALIAAPVLATGARGHPVGFAASLREELRALGGDEGARSVILRHRDRVRLIAVEDAGIARDIDRPEDLL